MGALRLQPWRASSQQVASAEASGLVLVPDMRMVPAEARATKTAYELGVKSRLTSMAADRRASQLSGSSIDSEAKTSPSASRSPMKPEAEGGSGACRLKPRVEAVSGQLFGADGRALRQPAAGRQMRQQQSGEGSGFVVVSSPERRLSSRRP